MNRIEVTVIRPRPKGRHGDPVPNTAEVRFRLPGVLFAPGGSRELTANQNTVTTDAAIYTPAGPPATDVLPKDRIEVPGEGVFQVEGEVAAWGRFGCVIQLSKVTG